MHYDDMTFKGANNSPVRTHALDKSFWCANDHEEARSPFSSGHPHRVSDVYSELHNLEYTSPPEIASFFRATQESPGTQRKHT